MNKVDFENRVISVHDNLALRDDGSVIAMYEVPASIISSMDVEGKTVSYTHLYNKSL